MTYSLIRTRTYQGVINVGFSENLAYFVFLLPPCSDFPFCLIIDDTHDSQKTKDITTVHPVSAPSSNTAIPKNESKTGKSIKKQTSVNISKSLLIAWPMILSKKHQVREHVLIHRSSHRSYSIKKVVFKNFVKFRGKHLCQSLFFNKVAGDCFCIQSQWDALVKIL